MNTYSDGLDDWDIADDVGKFLRKKRIPEVYLELRAALATMVEGNSWSQAQREDLGTWTGTKTEPRMWKLSLIVLRNHYRVAVCRVVAKDGTSYVLACNIETRENLNAPRAVGALLKRAERTANSWIPRES